jgi:hypothetical protein
MGTILDAEMPGQVIGPAQADCGGLAWTRTFSCEETCETGLARGSAGGAGY